MTHQPNKKMGAARLVAAVMLAALALLLWAPAGARASEAGRRNTTYALGALTGLLAAKGKMIPAAIAGVGTYAAYHNYQAEIDARHRREHQLQYLHSYRAGYVNGRATHHKTVHHRVVHHRRKH